MQPAEPPAPYQKLDWYDQRLAMLAGTAVLLGYAGRVSDRGYVKPTPSTPFLHTAGMTWISAALLLLASVALALHGQPNPEQKWAYMAPQYRHLLDDTKVSIIDINVLLHQTPGGMLSNLVNQLREMDALHKIDQVYAELPRVRKELGQVPLVTPTSQIVGIQTVNNVLFDDEAYRSYDKKQHTQNEIVDQFHASSSPVAAWAALQEPPLR